MKTLFRLSRYMGRYWIWVVPAYLCLLLVTGLSLVVPRLLQQVIDRGVIGGDRPLLVLAAFLIVGISVASGLFSFGQTYTSEYVSQRVAYDLRHDLFAHLQHLPFSFHDRARTGQLMSRATSDVEAVMRFTGRGIINFFNTIFLLIAVIYILYSTDWALASLSLLCIPFLGYAAFTFGRRVRPLFGQMQQQWAVLSAVLQENLTGARVVRAFAREEHEIAKFSEANQDLLDKNLQLIRLFAMRMPLMTLISSVATVLVLWYGGREVIMGRMSLGTLVAFNSYLLMLVMPVRMLGWIINMGARAIASGDRIFEILDTVSPVRDAPDAVELPRLQGHVRFEDVSFGYEDRVVLKHINLEAKPGQTIGLLGATGSGKTSIINLIPRFYDVTGGRLTVDGYDLRRVTLKPLRRQIGIVSQDTFLFSTTIRENIAYARPNASLGEIVAAAKTARAHDFIVAFPEGYETKVGERGVTLSGGQKQRIAIARALLMDPRILILDESTSSVDTETEYLIQQALAALMKTRTTFVIAQRLTTIKKADQIIVLDEGEIVARGTHEELMVSEGIYKEIYELQLKDQEELMAREMVATRSGQREG